MRLDPYIENSKFNDEIKHLLNRVLDEEFNGDWSLLLNDMMLHAVTDEQYELAALIRDYLNQNKDNE
tara:strand:- start:337 stop:537 length:201 start_codon:yes stop_codon:yes gene_type:complete